MNDPGSRLRKQLRGISQNYLVIEGDFGLPPVLNPLGSGCIITGNRCNRSNARQKDNGNAVPAWIALRVGINPKQRQLTGLDTGFLQQFSPAGVFDGLANIDKSPW